jgi:hypothetical protein
VSVTEHPRTHLQALIDACTITKLGASSANVTRLVQRYRDQFRLGPRDLRLERADQWYGVLYEGRIVTVIGEKWAGTTLEITDAYHDGTREGLAGFASVLYEYLARVRSGEIEALVHTCLLENDEQWKAVIRETGDAPFAFIFIHRKKKES